MEKQIKRVQITCSCGTYIEIEDTSSSSINSIMDGFNDLHSGCLGLSPIFPGAINLDDVNGQKLAEQMEEFKKNNPMWSGGDSGYLRRYQEEMDRFIKNSVKSPDEIKTSENKTKAGKPKEFSYDPGKLYVCFCDGELSLLSKIGKNSFGWVHLLRTDFTAHCQYPTVHSTIKSAVDGVANEGNNIVGELNRLEDLLEYVKRTIFKPKEEWQKLDINNIPSDILTGKYEFNEGDPRVDTSRGNYKENVIVVLDYCSKRRESGIYDFYYRKVI